MNIRVLNVVEEGRYGGPQNRILNVARRCRSQGIETVVVFPFQDSERFRLEAERHKVPIRRVKMHRLSKDPKAISTYVLTFPLEAYSLFRIIREEKAEIVHCNSSRQFKGVIAGWLAGKKVVWHINDTRSPTGIKSLFFLASFAADCFIAAGERVREYYFDIFPLNRKPFRIVQAPVDTFFFDARLARPDPTLSSQKGLKIVSIGNINPAKGYEYFIEAASLVGDCNVPVSFWIVGPSYKNQEKYLEKLKMKERQCGNSAIHFFGPSDDVRGVLKAADVYVCSSIHEASPISVWEAMSMGKPVVSTDVGDVKQFIKDGENGFIVPPREPEALAKKIELLCEDPQLREEFGRRARRIAIERLDIAVCAKRHEEVYREVFKSK